MAEKSILPQGWQVPPVFRARLGARVGRQRPMADGEHLLLVLHAPPQPEDTERVGRFFWRAPDGTWNSNELGTGVNGLSKHLDEYVAVIARLDQAEEQATTAEAYFDVLETLAPVHRAARNLHHVLHEARKLRPDVRELIDLRDRAYTIERTADLLYGETKNALDLIVAKRAEEQAQASRRMATASHRLNVLAAFFFPIITLMAIFGADLATVARLFGAAGDSRATMIAFLVVTFFALGAGGVLTAIIIRPDAGARPKPATPPKRSKSSTR